MKKRLLIAVSCSLLAMPLVFSDQAASAIRAPSSALQEPLSGREAPRSTYAGSATARPSFLSRLKARFEKFRPVSRARSGLALSGNEEVLREQLFIDRIYDREMTARVRDQYAGAVRPFEEEALSSYQRASRREQEQYIQSRKDMASWVLKEVGKDQLKDFLRRGDSTNGTMKMLSSVEKMSSGEKKPSAAEQKAAAKLSESERIARAHRMDIPASEKKDEPIPTRVRARLNVLKAQGQVTLQNPIVTTMVEARGGSGDNLAVEVNREFKDVGLNSRVRYAVDSNLLVFNVNKQLTDEVVLDLNSEQYTGGTGNFAGEKRRETAKVTYSLSF